MILDNNGDISDSLLFMCLWMSLCTSVGSISAAQIRVIFKVNMVEMHLFTHQMH